MITSQTLADLVFGPSGSVSKREMKTLYKSSSTREMKKEIKSIVPGVRWAGVWGQVRTLFPSLFQVPATDIFFYGWEKIQQAGQAIQPEQYLSDERIQVPLHDRTYISEHSPRIEFYYNGKKVSELEFQFVFELYFESLILVFKQGKLIELQPGKCYGIAELGLKNRTIFRRQLKSIEWPGTISILQDRAGRGEPTGPQETLHLKKTSPQLPPVRRKRGFGCFLCIMILFITGSIATLCFLENGFDCRRWIESLLQLFQH